MMQKILATALILTTSGPMPAMAADTDCYVPMADWKPKHEVKKMAEDNGWTVRRIKIDNGCYEVYLLDSEGGELEARVNPATLKIIHIEKESFFKRSDEIKEYKSGSEIKVKD